MAAAVVCSLAGAAAPCLEPLWGRCSDSLRLSTRLWIRFSIAAERFTPGIGIVAANGASGNGGRGVGPAGGAPQCNKNTHTWLVEANNIGQKQD